MTKSKLIMITRIMMTSCPIKLNLLCQSKRSLLDLKLTSIVSIMVILDTRVAKVEIKTKILVALIV